MKKSTIVVLVVLAAIVLGGLGLALRSSSQSDSAADRSASTSSADVSTEEHSAPTAQTQTSTSTVAETNTVDIKDFAFVPAKIKVKKGTTVTWTNQDGIRHDVVPDNENADFKGSELLAKGESYSWTFNTVGTYSYHCSPHPYMKGTVEVVE